MNFSQLTTFSTGTQQPPGISLSDMDVIDSSSSSSSSSSASSSTHSSHASHSHSPASASSSSSAAPLAGGSLPSLTSWPQVNGTVNHHSNVHSQSHPVSHQSSTSSELLLMIQAVQHNVTSLPSSASLSSSSSSSSAMSSSSSVLFHWLLNASNDECVHFMQKGIDWNQVSIWMNDRRLLFDQNVDPKHCAQKFQQFIHDERGKVQAAQNTMKIEEANSSAASLPSASASSSAITALISSRLQELSLDLNDFTAKKLSLENQCKQLEAWIASNTTVSSQSLVQSLPNRATTSNHFNDESKNRFFIKLEPITPSKQNSHAIDSQTAPHNTPAQGQVPNTQAQTAARTAPAQSSIKAQRSPIASRLQAAAPSPVVLTPQAASQSLPSPPPTSANASSLSASATQTATQNQSAHQLPSSPVATRHAAASGLTSPAAPTLTQLLAVPSPASPLATGSHVSTRRLSQQLESAAAAGSTSPSAASSVSSPALGSTGAVAPSSRSILSAKDSSAAVNTSKQSIAQLAATSSAAAHAPQSLASSPSSDEKEEKRERSSHKRARASATTPTFSHIDVIKDKEKDKDGHAANSAKAEEAATSASSQDRAANSRPSKVSGDMKTAAPSATVESDATKSDENGMTIEKDDKEKESSSKDKEKEREKEKDRKKKSSASSASESDSESESEGLTHEQIMAKLNSIVQRVMDHKDAPPFMELVDASDAPGYYDIIKEPLSLGEVKTMMVRSIISQPLELYHFLNLIYANAYEYNDRKSPYYKMARTLDSFTTQLFKQEFPKLSEQLQLVIEARKAGQTTTKKPTLPQSHSRTHLHAKHSHSARAARSTHWSVKFSSFAGGYAVPLGTTHPSLSNVFRYRQLLNAANNKTPSKSIHVASSSAAPSPAVTASASAAAPSPILSGMDESATAASRGPRGTKRGRDRSPSPASTEGESIENTAATPRPRKKDKDGKDGELSSKARKSNSLRSSSDEDSIATAASAMAEDRDDDDDFLRDKSRKKGEKESASAQTPRQRGRPKK